MVKFRPVKENSFKEYFSYFINPFFNRSLFAESKADHRYKKTKAAKNISSYFNRFISDTSVKQVYKVLEFLHQSSTYDFEQQKKQGLIPKGLHPLEEKEWIIEYLKPRIDNFNAESAWLVMVNMGHRDKYMRFLSRSECLNRFEIFVQNYFFASLPESMLVEIFLLAYDGEEVERKEKLEHLMECLCHKQTVKLIDTLKKTIADARHWVAYCEILLGFMRNAQIKSVLSVLPNELEDLALKKLYPYDIIEVVEQMEDAHQKERMIQKVLKNRKDWWRDFSHDEVYQALSILNSR